MSSLTAKFDTAIKAIVTYRYQTEINLASGLNMFVRIIRQTQPYKDIVECLKADVMYEEKVAVILKRMSIEDFNRAYANPNDDPMSVLAVALIDCGHDKQSIYEIVKDAALCFWLPMILTREYRLQAVGTA